MSFLAYLVSVSVVTRRPILQDAQMPVSPDDAVPSRAVQVRRENFPNEISDGISSYVIVLYRTRSWDDLERSGHSPLSG
jgi:hypothetical protein